MNIISYAIGLNSSGGGSGGGGDAPTAEELTLTNNCQYAFASPAWEWFLNKYGNQITTTNLTSLEGTFKGSNLSTIPFSLNATMENNGCRFYETFKNCENLTSVPTITGKVSYFYAVFSGCSKLTTIPDSLGELDFTIMNIQPIQILVKIL